VEFRILGPLEVLDEDTPLGPFSPRQRALLIALALHRGNVVPRERLLDDLWADSPPATGLGVLQNYISQLRKALGADRIVTRGPGYALAATADEIDLARFEAGLAAAREAQRAGDDEAAGKLVEAVLSLWRGAPLADVAAEAFAQPEIVRLRELRAGAVELAAECALAAGRHAELTATLEAAVAEEPLRERLWWLLMLALYRSGRQADALRAYQKARRTLAEELGISPGAALRDLEVAVLQQRADLDRQSGAGPPTAAPSGPAPAARRRAVRAPAPPTALVGRASERAALTVLLDPASTSNALVILGEPGIGKSRLLEEARHLATADGLTVVSGRAYAAERGRPYGVWADALRSAPLPPLPAELRVDLSALLPDLSERRGELPEPARLHDAVTDLLVRLGGPLMLLDDVQWLDEPSAQLLHVVARSGVARAVLLAARPGELADNPACAGVVRELRRDGLLTELPIGPLDPDAVRELATEQGDLDADRVVATGTGNPLLVLELARALLRGESLPGGAVHTLISDRLATLRPDAAALVPWVAAFGRPIAPAVLAEVAGVPSLELLDRLEELERHGVLRADAEGTYDLAHDLVRDVAYAAVSPPRRALLHGRIAAVLAAGPDPDGVLAAEVARHADLAEDSATCAPACVRAGTRCLRVLAYPQVEEFVALGRKHAARLAEGPRLRTEIDLIRLLLQPGLRLHSADELAEEIADLCARAQRAGTAADLAAALILLGRVHHHVWGDLPRARTLLARSVEVMARGHADGADANIEPLLESARCLAWLEMDMPRTKALFDNLAAVGPLAERSVNYQWGLGLVSIWAGDTATARQALSTGAELAARTGEHWAGFECTARLAVLEAEAGRADVALALTDGLPALAEPLGTGGSEQAYAAAVQALALHAVQAPSAPAALAAAVAGLESADARLLVPEVLNLAAELDVAAGRLPDAAERARAALEVAVAVSRPQEAARAHGVLACLAASAGRLGEAETHAAQALAGDVDRLPARVLALVDRARQLAGRHRELPAGGTG
jgi:DNA-binding SARP family transcriptional activator